MDGKDNYIGLMLDNRYEILEKVGEGGMSLVYKARCHRLNRFVAVKILRREYAKDEDFRRRFHAESQAVAMLSHPNIVAVYDVNRSQGVEYLVMELIDGITLKQYMVRKGQLNWREALHFVTQIVRALGHAHSRGIVHRDIKPHNVMVLRDGSVKVADFGIARLTTSQSTLTQEALGSVHYISPEQAKGGQVDARSDIYSVGVLMYEILTGRLPFEGDNAVSVAIQHINSMPLMPREIDPTIPEGLEEITMKAMTADITRRYQSADEVLGALEEFRKNPAMTFGYFTTPEAEGETPTGEPTRTLPKVVPPVTPPVTPPRTPAKKPPAKKNARKRKRSRGGAVAMTFAVLLVLAFVGVMVFFLWQVVSDILFPDNTKIDVPPLVGRMIEEVQADTEVTKNFIIVESNTGEYSDKPAGEIVKQNPVEGRPADPGSVITVTVSRGARTIKLTEMADMEYRNAEIAIKNLGLTVSEPEYENSDTVAKGNVIRTVPAAGTLVGVGEPISLVISQGPVVVQAIVPDLIGDNETRAKERIAQFKLTYGGSTIVESDAPQGDVVWQSVTGGTKVDEGTVISLQISAGSGDIETSEPPDDTTPPSTAPPESNPPDGELITPPSVPVSNTQGTYIPTIRLPGDRTTVQVRIEVGDVEVYNKTVETSQLILTPTLHGTGSQVVNVYFDGVLQSSDLIEFK